MSAFVSQNNTCNGGTTAFYKCLERAKSSGITLAERKATLDERPAQDTKIKKGLQGREAVLASLNCD